MVGQSPPLISARENFSSGRPLSDAPRGVKETASAHSNAISAILEISENEFDPIRFHNYWGKGQIIGFFSLSMVWRLFLLSDQSCIQVVGQKVGEHLHEKIFDGQIVGEIAFGDSRPADDFCQRPL